MRRISLADRTERVGGKEWLKGGEYYLCGEGGEGIICVFVREGIELKIGLGGVELKGGERHLIFEECNYIIVGGNVELLIQVEREAETRRVKTVDRTL